MRHGSPEGADEGWRSERGDQEKDVWEDVPNI